MPDVQFRTGDVFLFEHDDSCISRLICRLSNSPISHAAMYFENGGIIEEGLPHIGTRPITELGDRAVHVRRYAKTGKAVEEALLKVARRHLAAKEPYSMGNLLSVGVLLVFNSWKPNARPAVKNILTALCVLLAKAIDRKKLGGAHGATCSQLVYEIYSEAGHRLKIVHKDKAAFGKNLLAEAVERAEAGPGNMDAASPRASEDGGGNFDLEKMCCVLLALLGEEKDQSAPAGAGNPPLDDGLYREVVNFASLLYKADKAKQAELDAGVFDWAQKVLGHMLENYAGFVSPAQLYSDCPDLAREIAIIKP